MMKIGILGGGQLARMMAQAGQAHGMEFMFLCPAPDACAAAFGHHICEPFDNEEARQHLVEWADVLTYEFENVPLPQVELIEQSATIFPPSKALATARDRLLEKSNFRTLDIPTAEFAAVNSTEELIGAIDEIGLPAILKTRTQGYDGKGQVVLREKADLNDALAQVGKVPCIVESMVSFERELSIIAARGRNGEIVYYPLSENHHREGILRLSLSRQGEPLQAEAEKLIKKIMDGLDYVGVLALELFQVNGHLYANEMAPRVHNSGHWTIEGAHTSQFENHLRAVCNMPLGETTLVKPSAMVNLVGLIPPDAEMNAVPGSKVHLYGKSERPGRKVGHINLLDDQPEAPFPERLSRLLQLAGEEELANQIIQGTIAL